MQRHDEVTSVAFTRDTHIADDPTDASTMSENAVTLCPHLVELDQEGFIVFHIPEVALVEGCC
jgi:hypothetical protein